MSEATKVEYILVDEEGETSVIELAGLSRRELARMFVRQTGEVASIRKKLELGVHVKVKATSLTRLRTVEFMMGEVTEAWLGRVANKEPLGDSRDVVMQDQHESPF